MMTTMIEITFRTKFLTCTDISEFCSVVLTSNNESESLDCIKGVAVVSCKVKSWFNVLSCSLCNSGDSSVSRLVDSFNILFPTRSLNLE